MGLKDMVSDKQLHDACMSYWHDYELMGPIEANATAPSERGLIDVKRGE